MNATNTNNTMIECTRDVTLTCIGQHVYDRLGEALMPVEQQNVKAVTEVIKTVVQELLPTKQLDVYNIHDIYEYAAIAWYADKHAHATLNDYDGWLSKLLDDIRGLDIYCDIDFSDEDMDIDWPIYVYRSTLPRLFGRYLASVSTDYDKEYRVLPYLNGALLLNCSYDEAVRYIDTHFRYIVHGELQLTEGEYKDIWKEAVRHYKK